jgi:hypothetical protein
MCTLMVHLFHYILRSYPTYQQTSLYLSTAETPTLFLLPVFEKIAVFTYSFPFSVREGESSPPVTCKF